MPSRWQMSSTFLAWKSAGSARPSTAYTREHCHSPRARRSGPPIRIQWQVDAWAAWIISASSASVLVSSSSSVQTRLNRAAASCRSAAGSSSGLSLALRMACLPPCSEAERLGDQDDGDPARAIMVDDQRLGEHASRKAGALHARVFPGQAVLAEAAQALIEVADQLLVADDEDDLAGGIGVGA